MGIVYSEHAPGVGLADAVRRYWTIRGADSSSAESVPNRVLPDNCIDVIFDLGPDGHQPIVVGPMLSAEVFVVRGDVDMLGVRFAPGAATEFLDLRASELAPAHVAAADVWSGVGTIFGQLRSAASGDRLRILEAALLHARRQRREVGVARKAVAAIERARGALSVRGLSELLGVTERMLQRVFGHTVGISPKQALRVQRFRGAASVLSAPGPVARDAAPSISRIAVMCGYADQAHLTRDFAALAGITPAAFRTERRLVGFVQD